MNIRKCRWQECCGYEYCNAPECAEYDPGVITNGDRVRDMSDEELGWVASGTDRCPPGKNRNTCGPGTCASCWSEWFGQPCEEGAE